MDIGPLCRLLWLRKGLRPCWAPASSLNILSGGPTASQPCRALVALISLNCTEQPHVGPPHTPHGPRNPSTFGLGPPPTP